MSSETNQETEGFVPQDSEKNIRPRRSLVGETHSDVFGRRQCKVRCGTCEDVVHRETRERCGGCGVDGDA